MFKRIASLVFAAALGGAVTIVAAGEGTLSGWLEVKGERMPLTHVFAATEIDRLEPGDKENVAILLTDKPVPPELRTATGDYTMWAGEQARAGNLNGIVVVIDPETGLWTRGQRLSKTYGLTFYSHTSSTPEGRKLRFDPAEHGKDEIAGRVSMAEPMRGMDESDGPWRLEAEFRTAVAQQDPVTERLTGAAAKKSPQYKAAMAFLEACKRKDPEAIRKTMDASSQETFAEMVKEMGRANALSMMSAMAADSLKMKDAEVVVRGARAEVSLKRSDAKSREETTLRVGLEQGVWKMTR